MLKIKTTSVGLMASALLFWLFVLVCWFINLYQLLSCDFDLPFKDEVIHAIGLLPIASVVTVWF